MVYNKGCPILFLNTDESWEGSPLENYYVVNTVQSLVNLLRGYPNSIVVLFSKCLPCFHEASDDNELLEFLETIQDSYEVQWVYVNTTKDFVYERLVMYDALIIQDTGNLTIPDCLKLIEENNSHSYTDCEEEDVTFKNMGSLDDLFDEDEYCCNVDISEILNSILESLGESHVSSDYMNSIFEGTESAHTEDICALMEEKEKTLRSKLSDKEIEFRNILFDDDDDEAPSNFGLGFDINDNNGAVDSPTNGLPLIMSSEEEQRLMREASTVPEDKTVGKKKESRPARREKPKVEKGANNNKVIVGVVIVIIVAIVAFVYALYSMQIVRF